MERSGHHKPAAAVVRAGPRVIAVDLDGTLVQTDTLLELALQYVRVRPVRGAGQLVWWLLHGKVRLKAELADRVPLAVALLPYHQELLEYLRSQRSAGTQLVLATAAAPAVAAAVAAYLQLFSAVIARRDVHLSGARKAEALVARFGRRGFWYVGNSWRDVPVWRAAARALVVSGQWGLAAHVRRAVLVERHFVVGRFTWGTGLAVLRCYQWFKNLLVLVPAIAAHQLFASSTWPAAAVALGAFSLMASAGYILNDLFDLPADRQHPRKRCRPFAAGAISPWFGVWLIPALAGAALAIGWLLPPVFRWWLAGYGLLSTSYSLFFKRLVVADVLVLALLYTLRILAGGAATLVPVSIWLMLLAVLFFFSMALLKRYAELVALHKRGQVQAAGRGYVVQDMAWVSRLGAASGFAAVGVLALYIASADAVRLYTQPNLLWIVAGLLLYWLVRLWSLARSDKLPDDPVLFASRDGISWGLLVAASGIVWLAI